MSTTSTPQPLVAAPGLNAVLTVTRPDGTIAAAVTYVTDANGQVGVSTPANWTDSVPDQNAGDYTANLVIAPDAIYQGASATAIFTIPTIVPPTLLPRDINNFVIGNSASQPAGSVAVASVKKAA